MKATKYFFDLFLYSNIFISICASAITAETYFLSNSEINWLYVSFVFFSTLVLYNFPTFFEKYFLPEQSERHAWIAKNKKLRILLSVIGAIACGISAVLLPIKFILFFIPVAIIAFAYFFPQTHLRSIVGLKATVVAFVWLCVTCVYPLMLERFPGCDFSNFFSGHSTLLMAQRFFFMLPLCILFNVRDMKADSEAGIKTIPITYGLRATKIICLISLFLFIAFLPYPYGKTEMALLFSAIITAVLTIKTKETSSDYYYLFWIDGMILLQAGLMFLGSQ